MSMDILFLDGDLDLRSEFSDTTTHPLLVAQHITAVLNIAVGEWLVDVTQGMPWVQMSTQARRVTPTMFREAIKNVLVEVPEVAVASVSAQKVDRRLTATVSATLLTQERLTGQVFAVLGNEAPGNNEVFATFAPILTAR